MARSLVIALSLLLFTFSVSAGEIKRKPVYKSGETLECAFYFNWKFVWVRAGGAKLVIRDTIYNNRKAQYMSLVSSTNEKADAFFKMRDTLTTIFTPEDVRPLYYRKSSVQGSHVYLNEVKYNYLPGGRTNLLQLYKRDGQLRVFRNDTCNVAVYDMMSLLAYARTFDFSSFKPGQRLSYTVASGKRLEEQRLVYRGVTRITADDGFDYECLEISLVELDANKKERTIVNFFVTNDDNHLPILIDFVLNFGTAKARLSSRKGLLYPLLPLKK